jgi:hypothetical protein
VTLLARPHPLTLLGSDTHPARDRCRDSRISALRTAIAEGHYRINSHAIATRLIASIDPARLFSDLIKALHDESEALIANDAAGLAQASGRKEHLLRLLAPQASALRAMRQGGTDELERFAREAAQLRMFAS